MSSQVTQKPGHTKLKLNISLPIEQAGSASHLDTWGQDSAHTELAFLKITAVTGRYLGPTILEGYSIQTESSFGTPCSFVCEVYIYIYKHIYSCGKSIKCARNTRKEECEFYILNLDVQK
jgi:hypothetical protein